MPQQKISTANEYAERFGNCPKEALRYATENRRFEIEQYWKRAAYFWTLIAAVFAVFFVLEPRDLSTLTISSFVISCLGLILTIAWYLTTRASAYWHANWDAHVHHLEDELIGPLHKATIDKDAFRASDVTLPYRFSSTKIHAIVSLYVLFIWFFLMLRSFSQFTHLDEPFKFFNISCVGFVTLICAIKLLLFTRVNISTDVIEYVIERKEFKESDQGTGTRVG